MSKYWDNIYFETESEGWTAMLVRTCPLRSTTAIRLESPTGQESWPTRDSERVVFYDMNFAPPKAAREVVQAAFFAQDSMGVR